MSKQNNPLSKSVSVTVTTDAKRAADERAADERFVAWVLGYGYAAGHLQSQRRSEAGETLRISEPVFA